MVFFIHIVVLSLVFALKQNLEAKSNPEMNSTRNGGITMDVYGDKQLVPCTYYYTGCDNNWINLSERKMYDK